MNHRIIESLSVGLPLNKNRQGNRQETDGCCSSPAALSGGKDLSSATFITPMQSADFRNSYDSSRSLPLNRPRFRRILCQGQMSPGIQIVTEVSFENPSQMRLSEHDDVVEAFPWIQLSSARLSSLSE